MTQEQKDLLIKDLCTRLPYGVKVQLSYQIPLKLLSIGVNGSAWVTGDKGYPFEIDWSNCKPYLFPLSSMTEEQKKELDDITDLDIEVAITHIKNGTPNYLTGLNRLNWLLKNHFDIYDLITVGLAEDATGLDIY